MFKFQFKILLIAALVLPALPVRAQEAALEPVSSNTVAPVQQRQQPAAQAQQASGGTSTGSNLRHWSRFSQSSSSSLFRRVPAGTKGSGAQSVCHYIRPQCVAPGAVPKPQTQASKGPVKRYLAYNVPPGQGGYNPSAASITPVKKANARKQAMILGYGKHAGEVTYTPAPQNKWSGTPISCYGRYH
jgi:hypothetical protein